MAKLGWREDEIMWRTLFVVGLLVVGSRAARSQDWVAPPASLASARAIGLSRLDAASLKMSFAGLRTERNSRGEVYSARYHDDGRVELFVGATVLDTGTYSITPRAGGTLCLLLVKQMNQRLCTVWVAAAEAGVLLGYHPDEGTFRTASRPAP